MKLNEILITEANANDADFARKAYSGELENKLILSGMKFNKFLGKDKYDEYVVYTGSYTCDPVDVQVDSWVSHSQTETTPREYDGVDEKMEAVYRGKFYYGYDQEENDPHYWVFSGNIELDGHKRENLQFEGAGGTWNDSVTDLASSMEQYVIDKAQEIYDGY